MFSVIADYVRECHRALCFKAKKRMFDVVLCVDGCVCVGWVCVCVFGRYVKGLYMDEHLCV